MPGILYIFILIELLAISYQDVVSKKIINAWPLLNIVAFFVLWLLFPEQYSLSYKTLVVPTALLLAGFILFLQKAVGGGDAKLVATIFLLIPVKEQFESLYVFSWTMVAIGAFLVVKNGFKNREKLLESLKNRSSDFFVYLLGKKIPFAPALLSFWIILGVFTL